MTLIPEMLALALQHQQAGNLRQAEQFCQQILQADPGHADTYQLLGVIACQSQGRLEEAVIHFQQALRLRPDFPEAYNNLGNAYFLKGNLDAAVAQYHQALRLRPHYADPYCNLGNVLLRQNKLDEAIRCYQQALQIKPNSAEVCNNLGLALQRRDEFDEAIRYYRQAVQLNPHYAEAHRNLGDALHRLANTLLEKDKFDEAIGCLKKALRHKPNFPEAYSNLGNALVCQDKLDEAIGCFRNALRLNPDFALAHNGLGCALERQNNLEQAMECFRQALQVDPNLAEAHDNLGAAFERQSQLDEAVHCYRQALHLKPDSAAVHNRLACALTRQGQLDLALASIREALRLQPDLAVAQSNLLFCLNYQPEADPDAVFAEYVRWGQAKESPMSDVRCPMSKPPLPTSDIGLRTSDFPERRLRIGYVSPDLCQHAVARYFEPVLGHHDPQRVEAFCYADVAHPDAATARLQNLAHGWRWICRLTDAQVAQSIRDDRIDILVDLAGHTANHRLGVFAHKPAPVQATWLGYLTTTGLLSVDYRITDDVLDPPGQPVRDTEELLRLPGGMCCFACPADAPAVAPLPALVRGHLTFGSMHNLFKLNGPVFDLWSEVLKALPGARLLIFRDTLTGTARERIRRQFTERGIATDRLDLRQERCTAGYLGIYGEIDVSLDTFPVTGGVTTCESLWMGVPVLSLCGVRPLARNSAALLSRVGLTDWVVQTPAQYVALAARLENELDRLAQLRAGLRERMLATLCDAKRFTRVLEEAYRTMWRRWCSQQRQETPNPKPQIPNKSK